MTTDESSRLILWRMDRQDRELAEIKQHVQATNGRVKALELWKARVDGIRAGVSWLPIAIGSVLTGASTGVLVWILTGGA